MQRPMASLLSLPLTRWFNLQVHQGVELRVKAAMARAEQLEAQQELAAAQHAQHVQQLQQQHADLEVALQGSNQLGAELRQQLMAVQSAGVWQLGS